MTGADILYELLRADTGFATAVTEYNMQIARLPQGATMPSALLTVVSSVDKQHLRRGATNRKTDRIAVLIRAASYRELVELIDMVTTICRDRTGNIGGGQRVSVLSAGRGPQLNGAGNSFEQTADFKVSYEE